MPDIYIYIYLSLILLSCRVPSCVTAAAPGDGGGVSGRCSLFQIVGKLSRVVYISRGFNSPPGPAHRVSSDGRGEMEIRSLDCGALMIIVIAPTTTTTITTTTTTTMITMKKPNMTLVMTTRARGTVTYTRRRLVHAASEHPVSSATCINARITDARGNVIETRASAGIRDPRTGWRLLLQECDGVRRTHTAVLPAKPRMLYYYLFLLPSAGYLPERSSRFSCPFSLFLLHGVFHASSARPVKASLLFLFFRPLFRIFGNLLSVIARINELIPSLPLLAHSLISRLEKGASPSAIMSERETLQKKKKEKLWKSSGSGGIAANIKKFHQSCPPRRIKPPRFHLIGRFLLDPLEHGRRSSTRGYRVVVVRRSS